MASVTDSRTRANRCYVRADLTRCWTRLAHCCRLPTRTPLRIGVDEAHGLGQVPVEDQSEAPGGAEQFDLAGDT